MTNNGRIDIKGLWIEDLEKIFSIWGEPAFRAKQTATWIYSKGVSSFEQMTNLTKEFRRRLSEQYTLSTLRLVKTQQSERDKSVKFLFQLSDGETIESVLIRDKGKNTVCISAQVGCPLGCLFCATGYMGYKRNLTAGEIVDQILSVRPHIYQKEILNNVVYMGMGEPLLNYANVVKSLKILTSDYGVCVSPRRITLSTAGVVPEIYRLADEGVKVKLAISLHAADQELRKKLMPVTNKHSLKELLEAAKYYAKKVGHRVTFEYILIRGVNDSEKQAKLLARAVANIPCKINLIMYNPIPDAPFERPTLELAQKFREILYPRTPAVTLRISKGVDIAAACGQLKTKVYKKQKQVDFDRVLPLTGSN
ncbi:23S rRNA (adenine(2503)-C(2))-methyltransferase [Microgenomates group bacterium RBG_16_45_19]|nr:MAG: 23S rRNA (adenine(2503)-C(2))-methyltransferase [Microgenomates group bacterium RBG_16_45_19]